MKNVVSKQTNKKNNAGWEEGGEGCSSFLSFLKSPDLEHLQIYTSVSHYIQ